MYMCFVKNIFFYAFIVFTAYSGYLSADNDNGLLISSEERVKLQTSAKFFGYNIFDIQTKVTETCIISYEKDDLGVTCHIGWFSDGYVITVVEGAEEGKQTIYLDDGSVNISYLFDKRKHNIQHKYIWGEVFTSCYIQEIIRY